MHDDHGKPHDHHDHEHHGDAGGQAKTLPLLQYMIEHNKSHAQELAELAHTLHHAGSDGAAELIGKGVKDFEAGNAKLEEALKLLDTGKA
ncbi:hypothetical protein [Leadbettera azotonutricia]|uniref:DUF8180 domain-containing protein n=1 Tax=Leadbettera azotonutricia (strain ATCC BAA-888 / DSM 13862 / ZAS-9) TaxID=545695 RepID=F5YDB4_LEAAZ|nr:hypothetical protein [Leadbettera azotonutricia]AEF82544.1 hypothetical protein TREAZ_1643 [Leadbettera azotonutricia ZAS-9]